MEDRAGSGGDVVWVCGWESKLNDGEPASEIAENEAKAVERQRGVLTATLQRRETATMGEYGAHEARTVRLDCGEAVGRRSVREEADVVSEPSLLGGTR